MNKLVVCSFDNTLINEEEAISVSKILKIDDIRSKGALFCVYSDKYIHDILKYNHDFPFIDYIIADGAVLYDVNGNEALFYKNIDSKIIEKIINNFSLYKIYGVSLKGHFLIKNLKDEEIYKLEIVCNKRDLDIIGCGLEKLNIDVDFSYKKIKNKYVVEVVMKNLSNDILIDKICSLRKIKRSEVYEEFL